jgi:hypothetical protein
MGDDSDSPTHDRVGRELRSAAGFERAKLTVEPPSHDLRHFSLRWRSEAISDRTSYFGQRRCAAHVGQTGGRIEAAVSGFSRHERVQQGLYRGLGETVVGGADPLDMRLPWRSTQQVGAALGSVRTCDMAEQRRPPPSAAIEHRAKVGARPQPPR